jgi:hypothetical protein
VSHLPFRLVSKNPVGKTLATMVCDEDGVALLAEIVNEFLVFDEALGPAAGNDDCRFRAGLEECHATYLESVSTPERDRVSLFAPEADDDIVIRIPEMIFNHTLFLCTFCRFAQGTLRSCPYTPFPAQSTRDAVVLKATHLYAWLNTIDERERLITMS